MTTLVTIFIISFVGIILMLGFKYAEGRLGRRIFLPEWLHARDEEIGRNAVFVVQKVVWWCKHKTIRGVHVTRMSGEKMIKRMLERQRREGTLDKNGSSSMFLKEMRADKDELLKDKDHLD